MNKFVIIPEKEEENLFNLLPLVTSIHKTFDELEVNIIHTKELEFQKVQWPISIKYHQVSEKDFGPVSSIKLAAKMDDLFNITHSLNYRDEVGIHQFIKSLKAKNRLGWKSLVNDVFHSESVLKPGHSGAAERYLHLWSQSKIGDDLQEKLFQKNEVKSPENFFKDESVGPFLFISMERLSEHSEYRETLETLLESIKDMRVIIWSSEESELLKDLKENFDRLVDASEVAPELLHNYILRCRGLLTNSPWQASMACYMGVETFYLTKDEALKLAHFKVNPSSLILTNGGGYRLIEEDGQQDLSCDATINLVLERYSL